MATQVRRCTSEGCEIITDLWGPGDWFCNKHRPTSPDIQPVSNSHKLRIEYEHKDLHEHIRTLKTENQHERDRADKLEARLSNALNKIAILEANR